MFVRLSKEDRYKLNQSEKLILFYKNHPVEAARDLLHIELAWFQRKMLRDLWTKKYNLLLLSRGIGKTWMLAVFAVLYCMLFPRARIGIIAPSFKQAEFVFDKIADLTEDSPFLKASIAHTQRTTFKQKIRFHNSAFIEGLPLGTGQKVRGQRYNILLMDEYAQIPEEIIKLAIRPMMKVKRKGIDNKYVISSTAYYPWNHFYLQYLFYNVMIHKKPDLYALHEYIDDDLLMVPDPPFELDEEFNEMMKSDTTDEMYQMENRCKFPIEDVGFFTAFLLDKCTPRDDENHFNSVPIEVEGDPSAVYSMGVDAARVLGGDNFSITLLKLKGTVKQLTHVFTLNGATYQEMVRAIRNIMRVFNVIQIDLDASGGGTTIKDLLMEPYRNIDGTLSPPILDMDDKDMLMRDGIHILKMVNFTMPVVNDLYIRLKADMQHKNLELPLDVHRHRDPEIEKVAQELIATKRELLVLQAEGHGNYYRFDVPSQFKKDRATSLALANQAMNEFLSGYQEQTAELASGMWVPY